MHKKQSAKIIGFISLFFLGESFALSQSAAGDRSEKPVSSVHSGIIQRLEDLNQCAATIQHYKFPPTGYLPRPFDRRARMGKLIYEKAECASCHSINDQGGSLGPPLDGIGGHRGEAFLIARMLDPKQQMREFPEIFGGRPNIMPHPHLNRNEAKLIGRYLLSLPEPYNGFAIIIHPLKRIDSSVTDLTNSKKEAVLSGQKIFLAHGCGACHIAGASGGQFGPNLNGRTKTASVTAIAELLKSPTDNLMRSQTADLNASELNSLAAFLHALTADGQLRVEP